MRAILRYSLIVAFRDLLFLGVLLSVLVALGVSSFLGSNALTEQSEMSIVYASTSIRAVVIFGFLLFACFYIRRLFDSREMEVILSKPISREKIVLSYFLSFLVLISIVVLSIWVIFKIKFNIPTNSLSFWCLSLGMELLVVSIAAMFFAFFITSAVFSVLITLGFYILSRLIGFFVAFIQLSDVAVRNGVRSIMEGILYFISIFLPRLDLFTQSSWLIYGLESTQNFYLITTQTIVYSMLLLLSCMIDFRKREF